MRDNDVRDDDLRGWLRRGDPALDASELSPEEATLMRQRILATSPAPSQFRAGPLAALAAAAAAVLAAVLLLRTAPVSTESSVSMAPPASTAEERSARKIQFTTDGGTRIVWTLDPDFDL